MSEADCARPLGVTRQTNNQAVLDRPAQRFLRDAPAGTGKLVERDSVLAELARLLTESACGHGKVAVISGGIAAGKTALLETFEQHAVSARATLLHACGTPTEQTLRFGVVEQFFRGTTGSAVARLVTDLIASPYGSESPDEDSESRIAHSVCAALLDLAGEQPLVISVDDHQFADHASIRVLTYLLHRIGSAPVMLVFGQRTGTSSGLVPEALRHPDSRLFTLPPLSQDGIGRLLADRLDVKAAPRLAPGCHALTGGNPLLLHALIEDCRALGVDGMSEPVAGPAFASAVLSCLHRGGPQLQRTARAIAVLGELATPALLARFLGERLSVVSDTLEALELAGLTAGSQFRYGRARAVILGELTAAERSTLDLRAARLLHADGVAPAEVVGYLLDAGEAEEPWAAGVLRAAGDQILTHAERALALGEVGDAVRYLESASRFCGDGRQRATLTARLARFQWTVSPAAASRHHGPLRAALRQGMLTDGEAMRLVRSLAWHGQPGEAVRALETVTGPPDPAERDLTGRWLARWHPPLFAAAQRNGLTEPLRAKNVRAKTSSTDCDNTAMVDRTEQVLRESRVGDTPPESVLSALRELLAADQPKRAMYWCEDLLRDAERQHATAWCAVLTDLRSAINLRLGELADAERDACDALSLLSVRSWGVAIGSPLSHLVLATTRMGKFDEAERAFTLAIPRAMGHSGYWLEYLVARGHFSLATGRPHAALDDFRTVGDLAASWNLDDPVTLPWRVEMARALAQLGQADRATHLIREQLAMLGSASGWMRGVSLGVLASVADLPQRRAILDAAVDLLQTAQDGYHLAHVITELGRVRHREGRLTRARQLWHRALRLAERCHAHPLRREVLACLGALNTDARPGGPRDVDGSPALSAAERRVAELAVSGRTNREIGQTLHITLSTVEQHLTKVYRKLNIKRRSELPAVLPV
ncbi:AAA family ATPase [Kibdelosporangium persicum]|uniref:Helix-turn-helix transcriptional regulator n=1 Tax=Kibdelosporangium persicum TaxID=2698649 RepID=A0ABX2F8J4_9PSEU|nr:LuxR family transcriptional regulator [Kibdelosporangium persicum]NRN67295.1 Helix-turn-helix transcriptional regulator [Kibdelosporangium persicum]